MKASFLRRLVAEFVSTAFLVAAVVGSGIMAERLSNGNSGLALLGNTIATGAVALILTVGPISGAHFNPAVTLADAMEAGLAWTQASGYLFAQIAGGAVGTVTADPKLLRTSCSGHPRSIDSAGISNRATNTSSDQGMNIPSA